MLNTSNVSGIVLKINWRLGGASIDLTLPSPKLCDK